MKGRKSLVQRQALLHKFRVAAIVAKAAVRMAPRLRPADRAAIRALFDHAAGIAGMPMLLGVLQDGGLSLTEHAVREVWRCAVPEGAVVPFCLFYQLFSHAHRQAEASRRADADMADSPRPDPAILSAFGLSQPTGDARDWWRRVDDGAWWSERAAWGQPRAGALRPTRGRPSADSRRSHATMSLDALEAHDEAPARPIFGHAAADTAATAQLIAELRGIYEDQQARNGDTSAPAVAAAHSAAATTPEPLENFGEQRPPRLSKARQAALVARMQGDVHRRAGAAAARQATCKAARTFHVPVIPGGLCINPAPVPLSCGPRPSSLSCSPPREASGLSTDPNLSGGKPPFLIPAARTSIALGRLPARVVTSAPSRPPRCRAPSVDSLHRVSFVLHTPSQSGRPQSSGSVRPSSSPHTSPLPAGTDPHLERWLQGGELRSAI